MNLLDVVIIVAAVIAAVGGYRLGFVAGLLSWVGLVAGLYVGALLVPRAIVGLDVSVPVDRLLVAAVVLVGVALVGQAVGLVVGTRIHALLPLGPLRPIDRGVGAVVGVLAVLVALWLLLPAIGSVSGWPARAARGSSISRWVSDELSRPPEALETLRRTVGKLTFPEVFGGLHQTTTDAAPPAADPLGAALTRQVAASTVKVTGQACDEVQDGSGFAVAPGLVVTNAHVVAGEPAGRTSVITPSGRQIPATVVAFDPDRDLALLAAAGLGERALPLTTGTQGERGAVFGHPGGQTALAVTPAQIAQEVTAEGYNLYDTRRTSRDVFVLASDLAPGDSGGALVDTSGAVMGIAFAIAPGQPGTSYALSTSELRPVLAARSDTAVSTGSCLIDG